MNDSAPVPEDEQPVGPVEALLWDVLSTGAAERSRLLREAQGADPKLAGEADRLLGMLDEYGLLTEPGDEPGEAVPDRIGPYRVLRMLGRGGMGAVYLAEHEELGRRVALKVLQGWLADTPRARERFRREALATARIDHPAICPVYEVGSIGEAPYLAMRHVPGESLATWIDRSRERGLGGLQLPPARDDGLGAELPRILQTVETVAWALHAAHQAGLVHRDVKPGNIMVTPAGDPVLLDFGLAQLDEEMRLTLSGDRIGTPVYMAPEQIEGERAVGPWTDVYGLGAVLYECVTLRLPFEASTREGLYRAILTEEPVKASAVNHSVQADLQVVLEVALDKNPQRRYTTAAALAEDLARVRRREPIHARRTSRWLRGRRWCQRNPYAAMAIGVLVAGLVATLLLAGAWSRARAQAEANLQANLTWRKLDQEPSLALQEAYEAVARQPDNLESLAALRAAIHRPQPIAEAPGPAFCGFGIARDGQGAAWITTAGDLHMARADGFFAVHNVQRGVAIDLRFAPFGDTLVFTSREEHVARAYRTDGTLLAILELPSGGEPIAVDWHPSEPLVVVAAKYSKVEPEQEHYRVFLFDMETRTVVRELVDPDLAIVDPLAQNVRFSGDGDAVVAASGWGDTNTNPAGQYHIRVWGLDGSLRFRRSPHTRNVSRMAVDEELVFTGGFDQQVVLTNLHTGTVAARSLGSMVSSVGFLPNGNVYAGTWDGQVWLFDRSLELLDTFNPSHGQVVHSVVPMGEALLVSVRNVGRFLMDHDGAQITRLPGVLTPSGAIGNCFDGPVGSRVLTASPVEPARLWDLVAPSLQRFWWPDLVRVTLLEGGKGFLLVGKDGTLSIRDAGGETVWSAELDVPFAESEANNVTATPDLRTVVQTAGGDRVRIFDTTSDAPPQELELVPGRHPIFRTSVDPSGRWAVLCDGFKGFFVLHRGKDSEWTTSPRLGSIDRDLPMPFRLRRGRAADSVEIAFGGNGCDRYWSDGRSLKRLQPPLVSSDAPENIPAFSSDGRWLAVGTEGDGSVAIFDLEKDGERSSGFVTGPGLRHLSIWTGDRLVTTSREEIRLWTRSGTCLALLRSPRSAGFAEAVLSENGKRIVTLYQDLVVETWCVERDDVVAEARKILERLGR